MGSQFGLPRDRFAGGAPRPPTLPDAGQVLRWNRAVTQHGVDPGQVATAQRNQGPDAVMRAISLLQTRGDLPPELDAIVQASTLRLNEDLLTLDMAPKGGEFGVYKTPQHEDAFQAYLAEQGLRVTVRCATL